MLRSPNLKDSTCYVSTTLTSPCKLDFGKRNFLYLLASAAALGKRHQLRTRAFAALVVSTPKGESEDEIITFEQLEEFLCAWGSRATEFNVAVMGFKNSPAYEQRQTDLMLKDLKVFNRPFIDDTVTFSHSLEDHLQHLDELFGRLFSYEVTLSLAKAFLGYPSLVLLGQVVDAFGLTTAEEKLAVISS